MERLAHALDSQPGNLMHLYSLTHITTAPFAHVKVGFAPPRLAMIGKKAVATFSDVMVVLPQPVIKHLPV